MEKVKNLKNAISNKISKEFSAIIGGALFIAILSKIVMFLPFTPVPVTMQTLATMLVAAALGKKGVLSVLTYIALGIFGLPVISAGMFTVGYIMGFAVAAYVIGYMFEAKIVHNLPSSFLAFCLGELIIITMGATWLSIFTKYGFAVGFFPFLLGGLFKACLATYITKLIKKW
ncbi:MAG: biotin transporter BioY [Elusimicrobiota bacterium]|jgi:biotin transport system substrate-specific component|nr:biotin transporter BioY [Elusimicrobiota bacterium]